ncbi:DUF4124 domain-containing protein [Oleiagrimonas sp. MCCC 1A03011]|uniref:DUF4124 domain-containing protein n=1 Tax=Oleiagrimonas sp. MCCC 1A03011 TaxID=1926883 RepID=UPI000DC393DC|nr:DUF4124 domain-containing protein [Oleiagrimonas sp. MCCC 1A03011]RAP58280.1 hypothetical protein BTJ49_04765 [Oleiagrimonas sp. MCCC 1A03011]
MARHLSAYARRAALRRGLPLLLLSLLISAPAAADTIYKCTDRNGQVSYQDTPCTKASKQQTLDMPAPPPVSHPPTAPPSAPPEPPPARIAPAPRPEPAPVTIPQLYSCVRATDGKVYVSRNGHPNAYLAPLGMLGAFQLPLANTYGGKNAARRAASDPQLARGRITKGLVSGHYTWVQDRCRPMSPYEICLTLRGQLDEVEDKIRKAFRSDRPPLERQAAALRKDMVGCNR